MPASLISFVAALILAWLVFTWLLKVVKASITTAVTMAIIVAVLQLVFGIGLEQVLQQIIQLPETILKLLGK
jgi:predicted PurR-regulated permease PerM